MDSLTIAIDRLIGQGYKHVADLNDDQKILTAAALIRSESHNGYKLWSEFMKYRSCDHYEIHQALENNLITLNEARKQINLLFFEHEADLFDDIFESMTHTKDPEYYYHFAVKDTMLSYAKQIGDGYAYV